VVIQFRVRGLLRYLSHAESMRMFQRAFTRAGLRVAHSQGFNPHQRMSLVLPRSVGVESDDEMLCLQLEEDSPDFDMESLKKELPEGIEIVSARPSESKKVPEPSLARYVIKTKTAVVGISERIAGIIASEKIVIERRTGEDSRTKQVDVRPFLESIAEQAGEIVVDCKISPAGTIRVDEILSLLQVGAGDLVQPVRRAKVQWEAITPKGF
jgi:radical SAM-linked protein